MAVFLAVVKYAVEASPEEKRRALLQGLCDIAMELVAEHDFKIEDLERAFEDAQSEGELELDMKRLREEEESDA